MPKLIILALLLLLLPIGFDNSVRADLPVSPPDPGTGGDIPDPPDPEGDHPWGGERVVIVDDPIVKRRIRTDTISEMEAFFHIWLPSYYGLYFGKPYRYDTDVESNERSLIIESRRSRPWVSGYQSTTKER